MNLQQLKRLFNNHHLLVYSFIVLFISFFTHFLFYKIPNSLYWDENYHITSAAKYIDNVMFMESHPPLGKLFIALGEVVFQPNKDIDTSSLVKTDYIKNLPEGYSLAGVRFFPALFGMLNALVFFLILYRLSRNAHLSLLFSSLYLFDTAMIVHFKGAMLDSIQMFFILSSLLYFFYLFQKEIAIRIREYFFLGCIISFALVVKANSAILVLLFPVLYLYKQRYLLNEFKLSLKLIMNLIAKITAAIVGLGIIYCLVFYLHFALGQKVVDNRYYHASEKYKTILQEKQTANPLNFITMLQDNLKHMEIYHQGVPKYDPCKPGENGSLPITWPLMKKVINFRWDKYGNTVAFLYLIGNPIIWLCGFIGIILSLVLVISKYVFGHKITNQKLFNYILVLLLLYLGYMTAVIQIKRVMYLYHYFIPLIFSLILFFLQFNYVFEQEIIQKKRILITASLLLVLLIFAVYLFYTPFCYYIPLDSTQFIKRIWLDLWGMEYVN